MFRIRDRENKYRDKLIVEGLRKLLEDIEQELSIIESRLIGMCNRFNVSSLEELDRLFKSKIDNPEIDLAWPEYSYLIERRKKLLKKKKEVIEQLSMISGYSAW